MEPEPPKTQYIEHLKRQFSVASPILFLGAGFSMGATNIVEQPVPSAGSFAKMLWGLCFPGDAFDDTTLLQDIYDAALLSQKRALATLLRDQFTVPPSSWASWHPAILTMPWKRIYTLNVDNLVEQILDQESTRPFSSISALSSNEPFPQDGKLAVVHLNGIVHDTPDDITFSRSQYARRQGVDRAYSELANDLKFRPIVFLGSSLDEAPLWAHMELRGARSRTQGQELRQRSYLVVPNLNQSREPLLARHNVVWIKNTAEEFAALLANFETARRAGHLAIRQSSNVLGPEKISSVQDLTEHSVRTDGEYLLGAEPVWEDADQGRIAERSCFGEIWTRVTSKEHACRGKVIVVTGTAGVGKTSALMVLGIRLGAVGKTVGWIDQGTYFSRSDFRNSLRDASWDVLIVDDADVYGRGLSEMVVDALPYCCRFFGV